MVLYPPSHGACPRHTIPAATSRCGATANRSAAAAAVAGAAAVAAATWNDDLSQNEEGLWLGRHLPLQLVVVDDQHGFPLRVRVRACMEGVAFTGGGDGGNGAVVVVSERSQCQKAMFYRKFSCAPRETERCVCCVQGIAQEAEASEREPAVRPGLLPFQHRKLRQRLDVRTGGGVRVALL